MKPKKVIPIRPVYLREPGAAGFINGKTNLKDIRGKIGVYVIFEESDNSPDLIPVYVGSSGGNEGGSKGNLYKAITRHFYPYADDINDRSAAYQGKLNLIEQMQDRVTYYKDLDDNDYFVRCYIFPSTKDVSTEKRKKIKESILDYEREMREKLQPRDNPIIKTTTSAEEEEKPTLDDAPF